MCRSQARSWRAQVRPLERSVRRRAATEGEARGWCSRTYHYANLWIRAIKRRAGGGVCVAEIYDEHGSLLACASTEAAASSGVGTKASGRVEDPFSCDLFLGLALLLTPSSEGAPQQRGRHLATAE